MVVLGRFGRAAIEDLLALFDEMAPEIVPVDAALADAAFAAFTRYGKGIHRAASLNFGDCVAYALAKSVNALLLFKGNDFSATDVEVVR
jgi:ribonuclease VapC